jgi:hypothetical protein
VTTANGNRLADVLQLLVLEAVLRINQRIVTLRERPPIVGAAAGVVAGLEFALEQLRLDDARVEELEVHLALTRWVEVRCCCQPTKILGWLPVPRLVQFAEGQEFSWIRDRPRQVTRGPEPPLEKSSVQVLRLRLRAMGSSTIDEYGIAHREAKLALYSEDTPIEVLRQVREFIEAPPV